MLLVWNPECASPIHDHVESECFMMTVQGSVEETQYQMPLTNRVVNSSCHFGTPQTAVATPVELRRSVSCPGQVFFIDNNIGLHRIRNFHPSEEAVTLHLYVPPYESNVVFDTQTGRPSTSHVSFYSEQGQVIEEA